MSDNTRKIAARGILIVLEIFFMVMKVLLGKEREADLVQSYNGVSSGSSYIVLSVFELLCKLADKRYNHRLRSILSVKSNKT